MFLGKGNQPPYMKVIDLARTKLSREKQEVYDKYDTINVIFFYGFYFDRHIALKYETLRRESSCRTLNGAQIVGKLQFQSSSSSLHIRSRNL